MAEDPRQSDSDQRALPPQEEQKIVQLPLGKLFIGKINVRRVRDREKIDQLKRSILAAHRIDIPLLVRPKSGRYEIVQGSRRYTSGCELYAEGEKWLATVPCRIREMSDEEAYRSSMIENIQREDLMPYEEALFYREQMILYPHRYPTKGKLAGALGVGADKVSEMTSLNVLSPKIGMRIRRNVSTARERNTKKLLPLSHGLLLARLFNDKRIKRKIPAKRLAAEQTKIADMIYASELRKARRLLKEQANRLLGVKPPKPRPKRPRTRETTSRTGVKPEPSAEGFTVKFDGSLAAAVKGAAEKEGKTPIAFITDLARQRLKEAGDSAPSPA